MHIHILGICGTFMGGLALIARAAGHTVTGCDANVYPPMSTQLQQQGITLIEGFEAIQIDLNPDLYIVGNVITRGNPLMEKILNRNLPFTSGPQWLGEHILCNQHVLAVAGTHGKTTTASLLAWILQASGLNPNFLIGGIASNLGVSAHYAPQASIDHHPTASSNSAMVATAHDSNNFFVIEADEYDTAFFDKRSKFVHYHPRTTILNNLEFDHADIFPDLAAIERQFHHFVRLVPSQGLVISPGHDDALARVLAQGCWSPQTHFGKGQAWDCALSSPSGERFTVLYKGESAGEVNWSLLGLHNVHNALAAVAAAHHIGIPTTQAICALNRFSGIKRRMDLRGEINGIRVYDDFAHHPTAIATTLQGLRQQVGNARIIAVFEPRSNTMKLGTIAKRLPDALRDADLIYCFGETRGKNALGWKPEEIFANMPAKAHTVHVLDDLVQQVCQVSLPGDHILIMSNGGFGGFHDKLLKALSNRFSKSA